MNKTPAPPLSDTQRLRLLVLAAEASQAQQLLYTARIDGDTDHTGELAHAHAEAAGRFQYALNMRGFLVGDLVRITVDGPYKGREVPVLAMDSQRLGVSIEGRSVLPLPYEVEMVAPSRPEPLIGPDGADWSSPEDAVYDGTREPSRFAWFRDGDLVAGTLDQWARLWEGDFYAGDHGLTTRLWWIKDDESVPQEVFVVQEIGKPDEDDHIRHTFTVTGLPDRAVITIDGRA